ncbi:MAG: hypothetical protein ACRDZ3_20410 [Acidimicrobiia bacterium]
MKRLVVGAAVMSGTLALGGAAWGAAWIIRSAAGSSASARAQGVPAGQTPSASATGSSVTVSVPQVSLGTTRLGALSDGGYVVKRYATNGVAQTVGGSCATIVKGVGATLSCVDTGVGDGAWTYRVTPALGTWRGVESPSSPQVPVDGTGPSLASITLAGASPTTATSVSWTVTFDEAVTGVNTADFSLTPSGLGGTPALSSATGSGTIWTVAASTGTGSGTLALNLLDNDSIKDAANNFLTGGATGPAYTLDRTAPTLTTLAMLDSDSDGKVDQVRATFNETLATYTAGTAAWALAAVPSSGSLASVSVSGAVATLTITEGGTADTAVGSFTVALASNANGIRDALGNRSSFAPTSPLDQAAPRITAMTLTNLGNTSGRVEKDDRMTVTFSEPIKVSTFCSAWSGDTTDKSLSSSKDVTVTLKNGLSGGNDSVTVGSDTCSFSFGTLDLASPSYVSSSDATFEGSSSSNRSTISWSVAARTLTIELGTKSGGTVATVTVSAPIYNAPATLTDLAGNALGNPTFNLASTKHF